MTNLRPISAEDIKIAADQNYDLGRKHKQDELQPALMAFRRLFLSCAEIRLRIKIYAPKLMLFSDWEENTKAMQFAENNLPPDETTKEIQT